MIVQRRFIFPLAVVFALSFSSSRLPAQTNAPVLAIVGARIVDGSGNEPFDGTVVVRDGRIAEVGRSVRPPEGARIIDAHGRTVTPGLIDVRVHLPAGATDDALARLLAAYLYAGVTSIGVADLDEAKVDALRDHLATARIRGPRLVAAMTPPGAMLASTLGTSVPDASALADWKKRNATFVPQLVSSAASDKKVALDRLRAAQQAGVRIAVASNAGASGTAGPESNGAGSIRPGSNGPGSNGAPDLAPGTSTVREIGLLLEGGLTPLQALTAATSGSAWALGLQSDRAFLAVGQRGDLAVLSSMPSTGSGDVALVEQVFIGGEEIDRAAMHAIITRPVASPPEPTAATSGASSSRAATAAPTKPTLSSARAAGRAGKKGRARPDAAATANTETAPAATAPSSPTASSSSAPSASSAGAPGASSSSSAPPATAGAARTSDPAAPAPAGRAASASAAAAPGAPAPNAAAPSAAAPTAATATAAGAPIPVAEPLIDDFEGSGDRTGLGPTWNASNETGSATDVIIGRVVRGLRDHALHLTARMGDTAEPYARITVAMAHDGHPADVSQFHGLRFEARGQGRYRVVFVTRSVTDGRYHESFFSGSPLWTPVSIPFGTLGQTGAGSNVKWTGADLVEIAFQIARDPGQVGWLELDNVRFY